MTKKTTTKTNATKPQPDQEAPREPSLKEVLAETNAAHLLRLDDILEEWAKTDATGKRWNGFSTRRYGPSPTSWSSRTHTPMNSSSA